MYPLRRGNQRYFLARLKSLIPLIAAYLLCACRPDSNTQYNSAESALRAGELNRSRSLAEQGIAAAHGKGDLHAEWRFRLLRCEALLASRDAAGVLPELRTKLPRTSQFAGLSARQQMLQGQALMTLGRFDEAWTVLDAAHRMALQSGDPDTLITTEMLQGSRLIRASQWDASEDLLQGALNRARESHRAFLEAGVLVNLGMSRLVRHRYDEAAGFFERSAHLASPFPTLYSVAETNLATCYYHLGEFDRAIQLQLAAIAQHRRSGASVYLQQAMGEAGHAYLLNEDLPHAAQSLRSALDVSRQIGRNADAAIWAGNLALVNAEQGHWDEAERVNNEALRLKASSDPAGAARTVVYNNLNTAMIAVGRGDFARGEALYRQAIAGAPNPAVQWDAWAGLGRSAMLQNKPAEASRYFASAVKVVQQTRAGLLSTQFKLPFLTRLIRVYQQYVEALIAQGDYEQALAVSDTSRAQVLAERFGSGSAQQLSPLELKTIARENNAVILSYWLAPARSHLWIVSANEIRHVNLPPGPEIARLTGLYDDALHRRLSDPLRNRIPAGERLFSILLEPALSSLHPGASVLVIPDGALNGLNFETLVVPGARPHYWIEDAVVAVAPSIAALRMAAAQSAGAHGLLAIGDPSLADPAFPPLPNAGKELDSVERHFDPAARVVLRGQQATLDAYRRADPGRFAAIHFAAHATANRESPLDSTVLLSGGKLYARDVLEMPLNADLVTISACQSAGLRIYGGEGMVGFAWAFLRAGARSVIAGLWDVNDQSTAQLMDLTYRETAARRSPAEALRTAKLSLIRSATNFRKPYYWAPFQLYTLGLTKPTVRRVHDSTAPQ